MQRTNFTYQGRLAQFMHRADNATFWQNKWSLADLQSTYAASDRGRLAVYDYGFTKYLPKDGLIVEAGCGTGRYVRALRARGYNTIGIEWDLEIVKRTHLVWPGAPVFCGDVYHFPFGAETVDAVISLGVIEHFEEPWSVLHDTVRILKPGGILYLVVPYANKLRQLLAHFGHFPEASQQQNFYQFLLADKEIRPALQQLGFSIVDSFATNAISGLELDHPLFGKLFRQLPQSSRLINGLDRLRLLGPLSGHIVQYVAKKH